MLPDHCPKCGIDGMWTLQYRWNTHIPIHWTGDDRRWFQLNGRRVTAMCMICGHHHPQQWDDYDLPPIPRKVKAARWGEWHDGVLVYPTLTVDDMASAHPCAPGFQWHPSQDIDPNVDHSYDEQLDLQPHMEIDDPEERWSSLSYLRRALEPPPLAKGPTAMTQGQHNHIARQLMQLREAAISVPHIDPHTLDGLDQIIGPQHHLTGWTKGEASDAIEALQERIDSTIDPF